MILVVGGTYDSRKMAEALLNDNREVVYSSVTDYNTSDLPKEKKLEIRTGALDAQGLEGLLKEKSITYVIDATHPYASEVSRNVINACHNCEIPYIRFERPKLIEDRMHLLGFDTYDKVIEYLSKNPGKILVTTGSRQLEYYQKISKDRMLIRVLPSSKVITKCEELGYKPSHIIAMQGPFTYEMNVAMIKQYGVSFLITKDSGEVGGVAEKLQAATDTGVKVLFIKRPDIVYPKVANTVEGVMAILKGEKSG